ncbi:hypothetical protein [Aurantimonas sp. VKM B-3413]|uniref:hypothetical protein n=1 Tax=Aurantimonas sp. VKM B-3413 TaxID=2779401 RepID=UPI001E4138A5|nr:hypothetical protein [Aurantimonas sp. VKM B-3413]MCB8839501.1 hypothetical protein [Aurantimonas sp. VKM B-3413]
MRNRLILTVVLIFTATCVFAQGTSEGEKSAVENFELLVKIGVAIISGIAALLGLPMVYLTYRKTSVEIKKLELESRQLMDGIGAPSPINSDTEDGIRIQIRESPNSNVQVLADPRFLGPLLILLDFIFASITLSLSARLLDILPVGEIGSFVLLILSFFLLMPLAHQVMKVRKAMHPRSRVEQGPLDRQLKIISTASYLFTIILCFGFGGLIMYFDFTGSNVTDLGRYFSYGLILVASVMLVSAAWARNKLNRYLQSI